MKKLFLALLISCMLVLPSIAQEQDDAPLDIHPVMVQMPVPCFSQEDFALFLDKYTKKYKVEPVFTARTGSENKILSVLYGSAETKNAFLVFRFPPKTLAAEVVYCVQTTLDQYEPIHRPNNDPKL